MGLHRAGFDVVGVDIRPQPRYPFRFVQADALALPFDLARFAFIWASPPCQKFSRISHLTPDRCARRDEHVDLIEPVRAMLQASGRPWAIENVPGAPIRPDLVLTGAMFGLRVIRERWFELSFFALQPPVVRPKRNATRRGEFVTLTGNLWQETTGSRVSMAEARAAMDTPWMLKREIVQAVPPAYGELIGRAALAELRVEAAA